MKGVTESNLFVSTMSISDKRSRGTRYVQNFTQRKAFEERGADLTSQKACPSMLTAGNTNRTAMDASTKPAKPMFKNDKMF
jgi:hypothetical protein